MSDHTKLEELGEVVQSFWHETRDGFVWLGILSLAMWAYYLLGQPGSDMIRDMIRGFFTAQFCA